MQLTYVDDSLVQRLIIYLCKLLRVALIHILAGEEHGEMHNSYYKFSNRDQSNITGFIFLLFQTIFGLKLQLTHKKECKLDLFTDCFFFTNIYVMFSH